MKKKDIPPWRPRLSFVLLIVNVLILLLPVAGILVLRIYESALIRQTESELIAQTAFIAASYRAALKRHIDENRFAVDPRYGRLPALEYQPSNRLEDRWQPRQPTLDLAKDAIYPPMPLPKKGLLKADPLAQAAGAALTPVLRDAQVTTLSAIRITDPQGIIVSSTGQQIGADIRHFIEIEAALAGEAKSLMRKRHHGYDSPPLSSISRGTSLRVHVVQPIFLGNRIVGSVLVIRTPRNLLQAVYARREVFIGATFVIVTLVLVITLLTSLSITRPVAKLIAQARKAAKGDAGAMAPLDQPVTLEIAELSDSLSSMARTLEERAAYIQNFATHVSHEFKTPLTAMAGAIELLCDHSETMDVAQRKRFLHNIQRDVTRLECLVRRLLELARADMMRNSGGEESLDPSAALGRLLERYQEDGLQIRFVNQRQTACLIAMAAENFETIMINLIDNARQHAQPKQEDILQVTMTLLEDEKYFRLHVEDNGSGISKANRERLFEPFFTTARTHGGTGLGLPLVKALLQAHHGDILLYAPEDESVTGVVWHVTLPMVGGNDK